MNDSAFKEELERALSEHFGKTVNVESSRTLGGGCINNAGELKTSEGTFFIKSNPSPLPHMFEREAEGLEALHCVGAIKVPKPIHASNGGDGFPPYIITTHLESGPKPRDFFQRFGRAFAELHRNGTGEQFGFHHDNYIGSTVQKNGWRDDWVEFFRDQRLGYQLKLAERNGFHGELQELGNSLLERLDSYLREPEEEPTLLHGDLWGGNYMCTEDGEPAIIDPAVYYGRREADLAMTMVFGGFSPEFYRAYEEVWPLADGSEARLDIYQLYHLLNHLNLFGAGYLGSCLTILERYA